VTYGQNTTVDAAQRTEGRVDMTVNRTAHEGRVVVTHVSDETFESADDVAVAVDGDAAASASSYTELRQAASGGETSKYMVEQSSAASADADATVFVGINHFSTRDVTMTDSDSDTSSSDTDTPSDDSDTSDGDSESSNDDSSDDVGTSSGNGPGFGGAAVLLALISMTGFSVARRR
jgi:ABC-type multidrug transport system ATPase subunit